MTRPTFPPRSVFAAVACALLCAAPTPAPGQSFALAPARPRVLVLTSGEVYGGMVREYSYGIEVRQGNGSATLPLSMIQVNAASLDDAFFQLRSRIAKTDGPGRADLAAWCLSHGLPDRAREEYLAALTLEPSRDDWRRALRRTEALLAAKAARAPKAPAGPAGKTAGTGGLSEVTTAAFAGKVERILLSRCSNAGCHGGASGPGGFHLTNPSRSATTTRKNLAATLAFVGDGGRYSSPLLTACGDRPGRRGRTPFQVSGGPASRALLTAWVARVAAERPDLAATPEDKTAGVIPAAAEVSAGDQPADRPVRPDAFDPAEFNRRFAPAAGTGGASAAVPVAPDSAAASASAPVPTSPETP